jgi:hypothetical protein
MWGDGLRCHSPCPRCPCHAILLSSACGAYRLSLWASFLYSLHETIPKTPASDTRVLLCATDSGRAFPMTEKHHADARGEAIRLRRMMGSALMTDSYGESRYVGYCDGRGLCSRTNLYRWMGALANTRSLALQTILVPNLI